MFTNTGTVGFKKCHESLFFYRWSGFLFVCLFFYPSILVCKAFCTCRCVLKLNRLSYLLSCSFGKVIMINANINAEKLTMIFILNFKPDHVGMIEKWQRWTNISPRFLTATHRSIWPACLQSDVTNSQHFINLYKTEDLKLTDFHYLYPCIPRERALHPSLDPKSYCCRSLTNKN